MTLIKYSQLKSCIVHGAEQTERHGELINTIKEMFRDEINSVRRYEQIITMERLLNVLEIRDILSEDNVECLNKIALKLPNSTEVLKKITEYQNCHVSREYENYYTPSQNKVEEESCFISKRKRERILQTIVKEIGCFWRDLGRNLQVRECDIDDIENQNRTLAEKASKIMTIYDCHKADLAKYFVLCEALEKIRRKDLVKTIQDVLSMNI